MKLIPSRGDAELILILHLKASSYFFALMGRRGRRRIEGEEDGGIGRRLEGRGADGGKEEGREGRGEGIAFKEVREGKDTIATNSSEGSEFNQTTLLSFLLLFSLLFPILFLRCRKVMMSVNNDK